MSPGPKIEKVEEGIDHQSGHRHEQPHHCGSRVDDRADNVATTDGSNIIRTKIRAYQAAADGVMPRQIDE
jgi:hypothetical protein